MDYYKIVDGNSIVGVATSAELRRMHSKLNILIACDKSTAQVIEVGAYLYHGEWMRPFYSDIPYRNGKVIQIDFEEYEELKEQFDEDDEPIDIPPEEEPEQPPVESGDEEEQEEPPMSGIELRQRVKELEEENSAKDERIDMLEECILEMSEYVYA